MAESLEKKIKYEKIENTLFRVGAYSSTVLASFGIGLDAAIYNDSSHSNFEVANLFVISVFVGLFGHVCSRVAKRGDAMVEELVKKE